MGWSIENKIVVITGAASGIGLEMVKRFIENGARATIILDINEALGTETAEGLSRKYGPGRAIFMKCDVTLDLEAIYQTITNKYKTVDVLVNNAGVANEKSMRKTMEVNTIALMEWTMKFYDLMRKDRGGNGGTIINMSSIFGYRVFAFTPYYQASKFACLGFSKSIGHEYNYQRTGVRVIVLCPGVTKTNILENPVIRDEDCIPDLLEQVKSFEIQDVDAVGDGVIEIFKQANSGTAWLLEGSRSPVLL